MGEHDYLLFFTAFLAFMVFIIGAGGINIFASDIAQRNLEDPSQSTECLAVASGNASTVQNVRCAQKNIGTFFSLAGTGSTEAWVTLLILTPGILVLLFILAKVILRAIDAVTPF